MKMHTTSLLAACLVGLASVGAELSAVQAQPAGKADFDLICTGVGERLEVHTSYGYEWDRKKHKYVDQPTYQYDQGTIEATVQIEVHGGEGRIRPAKKMVPALASGGQNGWWPLHDLDISPNRIQATYKLNGLNRPSVSIDRRSGHVRIDGLEDFEGNCSAVEPDKNRF